MPKDSKRESTADSDSESGSGSDSREPMKKKAKTVGNRTEDSEPTWDLGKNKFAKVREFKGKVFVDIREFYTLKGELRPGKKGIALSIEQWRQLKASIEEIDEEIKKM